MVMKCLSKLIALFFLLATVSTVFARGDIYCPRYVYCPGGFPTCLSYGRRAHLWSIMGYTGHIVSDTPYFLSEAKWLSATRKDSYNSASCIYRVSDSFYSPTIYVGSKDVVRVSPGQPQNCPATKWTSYWVNEGEQFECHVSIHEPGWHECPFEPYRIFPFRGFVNYLANFLF